MAASNGSGMAGNASHCGEPESKATLLMLVSVAVAAADMPVAESDAEIAVVSVSESWLSIASTRMESASSEAFGAVAVADSGTAVGSTGAELDEECSVVIEVVDAISATVAATALRSDFAGAKDRALVALVGDSAGAVAGRLRVVAEAVAGRVGCARFAAPLLVAAATGTETVETLGLDEAERGRIIGAADDVPAAVAAVPAAMPAVPVCCLSTCADAATVSAAVGGRDGGRDSEAGADSRASSICANL